MRILHLISSTGYDGAENMASELIKQLAIMGVRNHIGVFYNQGKSNKDILSVISDHVENSVVFPCRGKLDVRTVMLLHNYIKENNVDIIHSHKYKTNLYSLLASLGRDCKLVSTCHNWLGDSVKMRFYEGLDKRILKRFDAVVGVSNEVAGKLIRHVEKSKIIKIDNGIDITRYCRTKEKNESKKMLNLEGKNVVGFIGRLSSEKGVTFLIDAVHNLVVKGMDITALIVGDGEFGQTLKDYAHSLGISDRIIFTGRRDDTPQIYSALDVFILPSLREAFPMVILEAMASSVAVVATKVGDIPVIIEDGVTGILVDPGDADAISKSVGELLLNKEKAENIGKAGLKNVQQKYSSLIMAHKYTDVYEKVLT